MYVHIVNLAQASTVFLFLVQLNFLSLRWGIKYDLIVIELNNSLQQFSQSTLNLMLHHFPASLDADIINPTHVV